MTVVKYLNSTRSYCFNWTIYSSDAIEEKVVTDTETPKSAKSDETSKDNHIKVAVNCQSWQLSLRLLVARHFLAMV